jgi:hypothetical protein
MDLKWFFILLLIALGLSIVLGIAYPVTALLVKQGERIYLGDTVDLSLAVAWPDYKLAWCQGDYYGCTPPDQIITITGYMHKYYIDPTIWHTGTYYRWDGQWNRGEYSVAFTILPGQRPDLAMMKEINKTPEFAEPNVTVEGPYHYLIARGDDPDITVRIARDDPAHLWLFGDTKEWLDIPFEQNNFTYSHKMLINDTYPMDVGKYTGYLQFNGKNGRQDVYWDGISDCLDTPYDDALIPDVAVNTWNPASVRAEFEKLIRNGIYTDDILVPITMQIVEPSIIITDLVQNPDSIQITGRTTWSNGTKLTLKLDPDNYKLEQDIRLHTWTTTITGNIPDYRTFTITCPIDMNEMYVGVHEFKMTVEKNKYITDVFHTFRISDTYVMPTPTPKRERVILNIDGSRMTTSPTTVIPTPTITYNSSTVTEVKNVTPVSTVRPIRSTTIPTTIVTTIPTTPVVNVPIGSYIAVAALIVVVWRKRM